MNHKLITHISPTISIYADDFQYILIIKSNPAQALRNADNTYHSTIASCFEEILSYSTKLNLADGKDKSMKEIAQIMSNTVQEIRRIFKPFEYLTIIPKKASTEQLDLELEVYNIENGITPNNGKTLPETNKKDMPF